MKRLNITGDGVGVYHTTATLSETEIEEFDSYVTVHKSGDYVHVTAMDHYNVEPDGRSQQIVTMLKFSKIQELLDLEDNPTPSRVEEHLTNVTKGAVRDIVNSADETDMITRSKQTLDQLERWERCAASIMDLVRETRKAVEAADTIWYYQHGDD